MAIRPTKPIQCAKRTLARLLLGLAWALTSATAAAAPAPAPAPAPACPGGAAWCEDFARGAAQWQLDGGAIVTARPGDALLAMPAGATALLRKDAAARRITTEHYIEARVRAAAPSNPASHAFLVLRHADARNWVGAGINLAAGSPRMTLDLVQMRDGHLTRLRSLGHDAAPAGSFQTVRVELANGVLSAWLDGEPIVATLPVPAPAQGASSGVLVQDGAVEVDAVRLGAAGGRPGRVALARRPARVQLQAGETARYPLSAFGGDGVTTLAVRATASDATLASASVDAGALVLTAHRPGQVTIHIASSADGNVGTAIAASIGPAFSASDAARPQKLMPAAGAVDVPVDTLLRIGFDAAPALGKAGAIRIYRAADRALVDVIRLGEDVDAIGPAEQAVKRAVRVKPVRLEGKEAVVQLHSARLAYGTAYVVAVDRGAFEGTIAGQRFAGIGEAAGWRFRTRDRAPAGDQLRVDDDGPADFRTVQGALNHAMTLARAQAVTIRVADGRYEELLYLHGKDNVTLRGDSREGVVIAAMNDDGNNPGSGLGQTADAPAATGGRSVFLVEDADLLTLERLTLVNTAVRATSLGSQAEALNFSSEGRLVAQDASFISEQDTVQVRGYAWFYRTLVAGNVDFIWGGNHAALFEDSEIRSVGDSAHPEGGGYLVQARTVAAGDAGFVFLNSRLTHGPGPAGNDVPPRSTWLARPGTAAAWDKVVYIDCRMDAHIAPVGWSRPKTAHARAGSGWAEYGSMDLQGKPLDLAQRSGGRVLTAAEAARYASRTRVFSDFDSGKGWNPLPAKSQ